MAKKRVTLSFIFEGDEESNDFKEALNDSVEVTSEEAITEMNRDVDGMTINAKYEVEEI